MNKRLKAGLNYILDRSKESSTWRGAILVVTALGAHFKPDQTEAIVTAGLFGAGFVGAVTKDLP